MLKMPCLFRTAGTSNVRTAVSGYRDQLRNATAMLTSATGRFRGLGATLLSKNSTSSS